MTHGADDGDDERGQHRGGAGEQADRDAGEGDVPDAVADQRQPALDEVDADHRGGEADEQGGEQRPLHEVVGEQAQARSAPPAGRAGPRPASACGVVGPVAVLDVVVVPVVGQGVGARARGRSRRRCRRRSGGRR